VTTQLQLGLVELLGLELQKVHQAVIVLLALFLQLAVAVEVFWITMHYKLELTAAQVEALVLQIQALRLADWETFHLSPPLRVITVELVNIALVLPFLAVAVAVLAVLEETQLAEQAARVVLALATL
jgi:hypothetical protein